MMATYPLLLMAYTFCAFFCFAYIQKKFKESPFQRAHLCVELSPACGFGNTSMAVLSTNDNNKNSTCVICLL
ncbi:MAG: hypothetical protein ACI808_000577 [Paraglaciecola sp.]|jgi:hypothetical protein